MDTSKPNTVEFQDNDQVQVNPDKYITFKRDEYFELMGELALPPWDYTDAEGVIWSAVGSDAMCAPIAEHILKRSNATELRDAVVIRKKDRLAADAFEAYANSAITTAGMLAEMGQHKAAAEVQVIADYFSDQAYDARHHYGGGDIPTA